MKKLLTIILITLFVLTGCSKDNNKDPQEIYQEAYDKIDSTGGEYVAKLYDELGIVYLSSCSNGIMQFANNKHEVRTPADMKNLNMRYPKSSQCIYIEENARLADNFSQLIRQKAYAQ